MVTRSYSLAEKRKVTALLLRADRRHERLSVLQNGAVHAGVALFLLLFLTALEYELQRRGWFPVRGMVAFLAGTTVILAVWAASTLDAKERLSRQIKAVVRNHWFLWLAFLALAQASYIYLLRTDVRPIDSVFYVLPFLACLAAALLPLVPPIRNHWPIYLWGAFVLYCLTVWIDVGWPGTFTAVEWRPAGLAGDSNTGAYMVIMLAIPLLSYRQLRVRSLLVLYLAGLTVFFTLSRGGALVFLLINLGYVGLLLRQRPARRSFIAASTGSVLAVTVLSAWLTSSTLPIFQKPIPVFQQENAARRVDNIHPQRWFSYVLRADGAAVRHFLTRYESFGRITSADVLAAANPAFQSTALFDSPLLAALPKGYVLVASPRLVRLRNALEAVQTSPWIGYGTKFNVRRNISSHNMYLGTWIDFGVLGPVLYLAFLGTAWYGFWRKRYWPGVFLAGLMVGWSLFSQTVLGTRALFVLLGLLLGLQYVARRAETAFPVSDDSSCDAR